jgi:acyl dehydratase
MNSIEQGALGRLDLGEMTGQRLGPYNSWNPVTAVQIWQWCSAMGERSPLFVDPVYRQGTEFSGEGAVAPPAMMQMWTMRDVNNDYAPGSTDEHPYQVMLDLEALGYPANVAISYDIQFHRYLVEGDRVQHYKTVVDISELKTTVLGEGYFFTDKMEYLDGEGECFAEALITYFQYKPDPSAAVAGGSAAAADIEPWQPDYADLEASRLSVGQALPQLSIPITRKLIIAGALATQDFIPVHHSGPAAQLAGMPDIFMNILTTCGLCGRYLGAWAGAGSRLRSLKFRLMTPNLPGDVMTMTGALDALEANAEGALVQVSFTGENRLGPHVSGSATLQLAS